MVKQTVINKPSGSAILTNASSRKVIEIAVPIAELELPSDYTNLEFVVIVMKNGSEIERWPYQRLGHHPKAYRRFHTKYLVRLGFPEEPFFYCKIDLWRKFKYF